MSFSRSDDFQAILDSFLHDEGLPFSDALPLDEFIAAFGDEGDVASHDDDDVIYTPGVTLWAFLSQMLQKQEHRSCQAAVERVITWLEATGRETPSDNTGTYCRARSRLPLEGIASLVRQIARGCEAEVPDEWLWHGRHVHLVDGSTLSMPDTEENQDEYPQMGAQPVGVGFPIARYVVLISFVTGLVHDLAIGRYMGKETGETSLFRELFGSLSAGDIVLADRYYPSWFMIALLQQQGVDMVSRIHHKRLVDFRRGQRLGKGDHVAGWPRPAKPDWMDQQTFDALPEVLHVRELKVNVDVKGFRTESLIVVTTLTDADAFSHSDIAGLYRQRWLVEIDIRAIKCSIDLDVLRSQSPEMVRKELWTGLLAYNLIRRLILQATIGTHRTPREVSFTAALQKVTANYQTVLLSGNSRRQSTIRRVLEDLLGHRIGHRRNRVEPRAIKRRPKPHKLLKEPRDVARRRLGVTPDGTDGCHGPDAIAKAHRKLESDAAAETHRGVQA